MPRFTGTAGAAVLYRQPAIRSDRLSTWSIPKPRFPVCSRPNIINLRSADTCRLLVSFCAFDCVTGETFGHSYVYCPVEKLANLKFHSTQLCLNVEIPTIAHVSLSKYGRLEEKHPSPVTSLTFILSFLRIQDQPSHMQLVALASFVTLQFSIAEF